MKPNRFTDVGLRQRTPNPTYRALPQVVDTIDSGTDVKIGKVIETGNNKYWALIEY